MKLKVTMLAVVALLTIFLSSAAFADSLTFTLSNPSQSVYFPNGATFSYTATVTASASNSGNIFLNSDSFVVTAPVTLNDSSFLVNFPFFLTPGQSFTDTLFTLTVPAGTNIGTYVGSFSILGGADGNAGNTLGTVTFAANVVPEPASMMLMLTGAAGLVRFRKKLRG